MADYYIGINENEYPLKESKTIVYEKTENKAGNIVHRVENGQHINEVITFQVILRSH